MEQLGPKVEPTCDVCVTGGGFTQTLFSNTVKGVLPLAPRDISTSPPPHPLSSPVSRQGIERTCQFCTLHALATLLWALFCLIVLISL